MFNKNFKKYLSITTLVLFLLVRVVSPVFVFAEDEIISPTPTPEETQTVTPSPEPTSDPSIAPSPTDTPTETPTPTETQTLSQEVTPTDDPTITPTPTAETSIDNSADVNNNETSTAITGENSITATDSATPALSETPQANPTTTCDPSNCSSSNQPSSSIQTGDAASVANVENTVNTTNVNSQVINQTINIFVTKDGTLDLSNPFPIINDAITTHPADPIINVSVVSVDNFSYITNNISTTANTGQNTINSGGDALIQTGNAYSIVSVLNQINLTIVNSTIHLISINIFGDFNGNIILPDSSNTQGEGCNGCIVPINIDNQANVQNNTDSTAISGQNSIIATGSGAITTGDAKSSVNTINIVNSNYIGANIQALYVNDMGAWDGNFIGWNNFDAQNGGTSLVLYSLGPNDLESCPSCIGSLSLTSDATLVNNISSIANSGGNSITAGNGSVTTGKAFSAVSVFNLINSNFINSLGFFGFINIFGNWKGDIGGKSNFDALNQDDNITPTPTQTENIGSTNNSSSPRAEGGLLSIAQSNNVGKYVLPGDTVTFFIETKNTGTGPVYDTVLYLVLIKDGQSMGGTSFKLGEIPVGKKVKVTTGLVLSKNAPSGEYIARTVAEGTVGPENKGISASADSSFVIWGNDLITTTKIGPKTNIPSVLGAKVAPVKKASHRFELLLFFLTLDVFTYFILRLKYHKDKFIKIFSGELNLETRLKNARLFLI